MLKIATVACAIMLLALAPAQAKKQTNQRTYNKFYASYQKCLKRAASNGAAAKIEAIRKEVSSQINAMKPPDYESWVRSRKSEMKRHC